jgi:hypothetical protein
MLAVSAPTLPTGPDWTYEVKWDGYRALAIKDGGRVRLLSRNQKDLTRDYPAIAVAIGQLSASRGSCSTVNSWPWKRCALKSPRTSWHGAWLERTIAPSSRASR